MNNTTQTEDSIYVSSVSATGAMVGANSTTSFPQTSVAESHKASVRPKHDDKIERAVYSHIQAVRTLGRTKINTSDIADALSLNVSDVNRAVTKLRAKGVRKI
jgi:hypothetical protein